MIGCFAQLCRNTHRQTVWVYTYATSQEEAERAFGGLPGHGLEPVRNGLVTGIINLMANICDDAFSGDASALLLPDGEVLYLTP